MKLILLFFILLINYNSIAQDKHLQYDIIVYSHIIEKDSPEVDSILSKCGYFNIIDTLISDNKNKYQIEFKILDLDCNCYYYFAKDNYLIVVNDKQNYILVTQLNLEILYIKTYYLKIN